MTGAPASGAAVNLIAQLNDERFSQAAIHLALEQFEERGIRIERFARTPEHVLAWIDAEFGGTWSTEAVAGGICVAHDAGGLLGFAAFDVRGLRFAWLRAWRTHPQVGIFGPFGVVQRGRKRGIGRVLLHFALLSLRERGYAAALIPVVRPESLAAYYEREAGARVVEMLDLTPGAKAFRTTVLASGNGSNFQAVVDATRRLDRPLPLELVTLITNRPRAFVLQRAADAGVAANVVAWDRSVPRSSYDRDVLEAVAQTQPDLVLLLGWMHVLPAEFVERFPETLNIHPAFLPLEGSSEEVTMPDGTRIPAFRGPRAVDEAFAAGVLWGGASVHRLAVAVDRGEVLARTPLLRDPSESKEDYIARLHAAEHRVLETAVRRWCFEHAEAKAGSSDNTGADANRGNRKR